MRNVQTKFVVVDERVALDLEFRDLESFDGKLYVDCNVDRIDRGFQGYLSHQAIEESHVQFQR